MHYAIEVVPFGDYANPRHVVPLAQAAEAAGWEGIFIWDHLAFAWGLPSGDPWVILAAVAQATERLKLATFVTPLPRRRPQVLAHTLATLDLLSAGRVIFCAGLGGVAHEFAAFGEADDAATRAAQLDEGLDILSRLLAGETVIHRGPHYTVDNVTLSPLPVQRPRIPIWIGGDSPAALRRAARWDGWAAAGSDENCGLTKTPQRLAEQLAFIHQHRTSDAPFDVTMDGCTTPADRALVREFADAGATWWLEPLYGLRGSMDEMLARVKAGPPA
jgi:probable F420-dependent oxidoreductase